MLFAELLFSISFCVFKFKTHLYRHYFSLSKSQADIQMPVTALRKSLNHYFGHQRTPSPVMTLSYLLLSSFLTGQSQRSYLHLLGLGAAFFGNYNMLYLLPTFVYAQNYAIAALLLASSLLLCTGKWNLYLFGFTVIDAYLRNHQSHPFFMVLASLFLCTAIYQNLIFGQKKHNTHYFIGFFIVGTTKTFQIFANLPQLHITAFSYLLIAVLSGILGKFIFEKRINQIRSLQLEDIKDPNLMASYLDILMQDFNNPASKGARLEMHQRRCSVVTCFCKKPEYAHNSDFYLQQMFENLMRRLGSLQDEHLWIYYIDFYLNRDQVLSAYYFLLKWRPASYFALLSKLRCEARVTEYLEKKNIFNPFVKQYVYGLQYDASRLRLSTEIHKILKLKIGFWRQAGRESLSLSRLQRLGTQIVERMYCLNHFYSHTVKVQEKYLYCFDSTVLYGMYLISTTNFKDYAKTIIKSTSKQMQEACSNEKNASQTFVIRTVIKSNKKSNLKQATKCFAEQKHISTSVKLQQSMQNEFKLIIDSISSGLCRILNIPKQQILGNQLNYLIPNCYKQVHNARLKQILDFNSGQIKYASSTKILHIQLKLLFRGKDDQLFSGLICIKYHMDITQGVAILSVVKKIAQKKSMALSTFQGVLMQKEKEFPSEVMKHSQVKRYLNKMKVIWSTDGSINQQTFSLMMNKQYYEMTIGSPFAFLLQDKQTLKDRAPPLHIQLLNEELRWRKADATNRPIHRVDASFRKLEKIIGNDQESSTSSLKGANSAIAIITNFSQLNSVPVYKSIQLTFLLVLFCNLGLNLSLNLLPVLPWDNSQSSKNPIFSSINMVILPLLHSKVVLNLQDLINYRHNSVLLNDTQIEAIYGRSFEDYIASIFSTINKELSSAQSLLIAADTSLLWPAIQKRLQKNLIVPNVYNGNISISSPTLNLTYMEVIYLYDVDIRAIADRRIRDNLLISSLYEYVQAQTSDLDQIFKIVIDSFESAETTQLILGISFIVLTVCLLLPMAIVLQKRYKIHQTVFDLICSMNILQVQKEIQSLLYIINILNNYTESQQILKTNFLDYQANKINPKHSQYQRKENRPSVLNQIVIGLQKFDVGSNSDSLALSSEQSLVNMLKQNPSNTKQMKTLLTTIRQEQFGQLTKQSQLKSRKRPGELDLSGSQLDSKVWVNSKHCIIYLLLLSFAPFLACSLTFNLEVLASSARVNDVLADIYNNSCDFNGKLYQLKTFLWRGGAEFKTAYNISDELTVLISLLTDSVHYDVLTHTQSSERAPQNTTVLKFPYSLRQLQGQMASLIKVLSQFRYNMQSSGKQTNSALRNIYQDILYLQFLNNQRQMVLREMADSILNGMFGSQSQAAQQRLDVLVGLVLWSVVALLAGLLLIRRMKRSFLQEVYILTFLNQEMLRNNKRVQSYLNNLSKSTYL